MWIEEVRNKKDEITSYKYVERFENPLTGKKVPISLTFKDTKRTTQKNAPALLQKKADEKFSENKLLVADSTFSEVIDMYLKSIDGVLKDSTSNNLKSVSKSIKNDIGFIPIQKLTPVIINNLLLDYSKKFVSGTVGNKIAVINGALRYSFDYGYLSDNTTLNSVRRPRSPRNSKKKKEWKYLEQNELALIVNHFNEIDFPQLARIVKIMSGTGLRYGELVSIDYDEDIDFENKSINVNKTYHFGLKTFGSPKSGDSRMVFFNNEIEKNIKEQILFAKQLALKRNLPRNLKLLFLSIHGNPVGIAHFNRYLKDERIEIEGKVLTSHIFRHTYITTMVENGVPTHLIAKQVGHSDTKMIEEVYGHFSEKMKDQLSSAVNSISFFEATAES